MKIKLDLRKDLAKIDGWTQYVIIAFDTVYSDRQLMKNNRMQWNPKDKTWSMGGTMKRSIDETELILKDQIKRFGCEVIANRLVN